MKKETVNALVFWIVVICFIIFCRINTPEFYL